MHSPDNQGQLNATHQEQAIRPDQTLVADSLIQQCKAALISTSFPENEVFWSNSKFNYIITKLDSLDIDDVEPTERHELLFYRCSAWSDRHYPQRTTIESSRSHLSKFARSRNLHCISLHSY